MSQSVITPQQLLVHWQGHRSLTRKVIEAFPDDKLFSFKIGTMRSFGEICNELFAIAVPGIKQIITGDTAPYTESFAAKTKQEVLEQWDKDTQVLNELFTKIEDFEKETNLFGQYKLSAISNILYFLENEIHHRGQGYVYLRALEIEPPAFWDRAFI